MSETENVKVINTLEDFFKENIDVFKMQKEYAYGELKMMSVITLNVQIFESSGGSWYFEFNSNKNHVRPILFVKELKEGLEVRLNNKESFLWKDAFFKVSYGEYGFVLTFYIP